MNAPFCSVVTAVIRGFLLATIVALLTATCSDDFFKEWNCWILLCYYKGEDFIACFSLLEEGPFTSSLNFTSESGLSITFFG